MFLRIASVLALASAAAMRDDFILKRTDEQTREVSYHDLGYDTRFHFDYGESNYLAFFMIDRSWDDDRITIDWDEFRMEEPYRVVISNCDPAYSFGSPLPEVFDAQEIRLARGISRCVMTPETTLVVFVGTRAFHSFLLEVRDEQGRSQTSVATHSIAEAHVEQYSAGDSADETQSAASGDSSVPVIQEDEPTIERESIEVSTNQSLDGNAPLEIIATFEPVSVTDVLPTIEEDAGAAPAEADTFSEPTEAPAEPSETPENPSQQETCGYSTSDQDSPFEDNVECVKPAAEPVAEIKEKAIVVPRILWLVLVEIAFIIFVAYAVRRALEEPSKEQQQGVRSGPII